MVIAKLMGGLGNQMFQYAAGRALAIKKSEPFYLDISTYKNGSSDLTSRSFELSNYRIKSRPVPFHWNIWNKLPFNRMKSYYNEPFFHFSDKIFEVSTPVLISGFWQSERYFFDIRDLLVSEFVPRQRMSKNAAKHLNQIKQKVSVALHIRRGDYVSNPTAARVHGVCSINYYTSAVKLLQSEFEDLTFFIFSDDHDWVKKNLLIKAAEVLYMDNINCAHEELFLMSQCRHNIISNSSFSWWGAWLNTTEGKKVVAPSPWFKDFQADTKDLYPKGWIVMNNN
jgi:hypothetical protein